MDQGVCHHDRPHHFHQLDGREEGDLLYHQFGLQLIKVVDKTAGNIMITNWMVEGKLTKDQVGQGGSVA